MASWEDFKQGNNQPALSFLTVIKKITWLATDHMVQHAFDFH